MSEHTKIVTLEVLCWAMSLGGEHFTGTIKGYIKGDQFESFEVKHRLTAGEAKRLNKKDAARGLSLRKPGDESDRFETREQLEREAIKQYKRFFSLAKALTVGRGSVANAQRVIAGPKRFMAATNKIVQQQKECGGYERNYATMERLFKRYRKLVREL